MLVELLLGAVVVTVAVLVPADVARIKSESLHGQADEASHHATPMLVGASRGGASEAFSRKPAGTSISTADEDAGPPRNAERISPFVGGLSRSDAPVSAAPRGSNHGLRNWHVRSRLLLLVIIPAVTVTVLVFCVVGLADVLHGSRIHSSSDAVRTGAVLSVVAIAAVMVVILALAAWFTIVAARSVLRPLYRLRAGALEAASGRLPDAARRTGENDGQGTLSDLRPIDVEFSDEIGDIARAFSQMRGQLLRMATNEATVRGKLDAMFVNLSHRSQSLAERQIRLVENLEQGEQDRERLANLSRMSRIATRMHRNSQNLLVLAGHELSSGWNQPMPLVNVVRAAVSEIEEHERVSLHPQPDVAVSGPVVNDAVHLLAELTENATSFSAVDMAVDISGYLVNSGGLVIDITDRGVGMSTRELAYANWRLENPPTADIDVPKWIGLFVVARLAARHGIRIRLQQAEFGGLTALVWLPDEVLVQPGTSMPPMPGGSGAAGLRRGWHEAGRDLGRAAAEQGAATTPRSEELPSREDARSVQLGRQLIADAGRRPGPAWSAEGPRPAPETIPAATTVPSGSGRPDVMGEQTNASGQAPALSGADTGDVASGGFRQDRRSDSGSSVSGRSWTPQSASASMATAAPTGHETNPAEASVILPPAEDKEKERRLPIYDAVESQWFRVGADRNTFSSPDVTGTTGGRWSSPADDGWRAAETVESPSSGAATSAGLPKRLPKANLIPGTIAGTQPAALPNRSAAAARERLAGLQRGVSEGRAAASEAASPEGEDES